MTRGRMLGVFTLAVGVMFVASLPAIAADNSIGYPIGSQPIAFAAGRVPPGPPPVRYGLHLANPVHQIPKPTYARVADRAQQDSPLSALSSTSTITCWVWGTAFPDTAFPMLHLIPTWPLAIRKSWSA